MKKKIFAVFVVLTITALACNFATSNTGSPSNVDATAMVLSFTATALANTQLAPSNTPLVPTETPTVTATTTTQPSETPCTPHVTATVDVNVRTGPGPVYDRIGFLKLGESAEVAGKNNSGTWWYINFAAGSGGHAWVWGEAVDAACIPDNLQKVADPPTPTPKATVTSTTSPAVGDLVLQEFFQSVGGEIIIRIANQPGGSLSGSFQYKVFSDGTKVAQSTCPVPVGSAACWTGWTGSGSHEIRVVIDSNDHIPETNEGNNSQTMDCNFTTKVCS